MTQLPQLNPVEFLVIDDDDEDIELLCDVLDNRGFANPLTVARSVSAALDLLREAPKRFGIVLVDLHMPRHDGFELLRMASELRKEVALSSKVFVLTSSPRAEDRERALSLGAAGYLTKPLTDQSIHYIVTTIDAMKIYVCEAPVRD